MKRFVLLLLFQFILIFTYGQKQSDLLFESIEIDAGKIPEGPEKKFIFKFKNIGEHPITIDVKSSCGCLIPVWNRKVILPNETDTIYGVYMTSGRPGPFTKSLSVRYYTNKEVPDSFYVLIIKGIVTSYSGLKFYNLTKSEMVINDDFGYHIKHINTKNSFIKITNNDTIDLKLNMEDCYIFNNRFNTAFTLKDTLSNERVNKKYWDLNCFCAKHLKPKESIYMLINMFEDFKGLKSDLGFSFLANQYIIRVNIDE